MSKFFKPMLLIIFILLIVFQASPSFAAKYAVIVGINDYINYGEEDMVDLAGCENDAMLFREMLVEQFGFESKNIVMLLSQDATKGNIKKAFSDVLADRCQAGDTAVFYYSGHGTYFDDYSGDEADGLDEGLCPADMDDYTIDNYIIDDELSEWIGQVKTNNFTIILDSCYSGTATKQLGGGKAFGKVKFFKNPLTKGKVGVMSDRTAGDRATSNYTLITGCSEDQTSQESTWTYDDVEYFDAGVMTVNLIDTLYNSVPGEVQYEEVMEETITNIKAFGYEQDPQLDGNYNRPFFGSPPEENYTSQPENNSVPPEKPFVLVTGVDGKSVELGGGSGNKITVGSIYEIYPPGETDFSGPGTGIVEITSVSILFSEGKILEGYAEKNGRAVKVAHNYGGITLNLYIDREDLKEGLEGELSAIDYVRVTDNPENCDRVITGNVSEEDNYYVHVYTRDGREGTSASGAPWEVLTKIRPYLDNAFAIKQLSKLSNPSPDFNIKLWTDRGYVPEYEVNELINFYFKADRDCYLTLIDISTDGSVTILFPNQFNSNNKIKANETYTIPSTDMGFQIRVTGPEGQEMVKAIATDEPIDLSSIAKEDGSQAFKSMSGKDGGTEFVGNIQGFLSSSLSEEMNKSGDTVLPVDGWATEEMIIMIKD